MRLATAIVLLGVLTAASAGAESLPTMITPGEITWGAAPASLPAGAQAAVLYGDPAKAGPFTMRVKLPKGLHIAPHTHPGAEIVTVISGTFNVSASKTVDDSKAKVLPAGSFFAIEPGTPHYAFASEDTVIQINGQGPWGGIDYINPKDDPRQKAQ